MSKSYKANNPRQNLSGTFNWINGFILNRDLGRQTLKHLRRGLFHTSSRTRALCIDLDRLILEVRESIKNDFHETKRRWEEEDKLNKGE